MKLVVAIVRPEKLRAVLEELFQAEVQGLTITRVQGHGGEREHVATYRGTEKIDFGVLEIDTENTVTGFREKPDYHFIVSMGIYVFKRTVLDLVPESKPYGFDQLMLDLLRHNRRVCSFPHDGFWLDIGRPADYEKAQGEVERVRRLL